MKYGSGEGKRGRERTSARKLVNKFDLGLEGLGKSCPREEALGKGHDPLGEGNLHLLALKQ